MFVGHGFVAFALAAAGAHAAGWSRDRVLLVGLLAGAFGLAPDVDVLYAPLAIAGAGGPFEAAEAFWRASGLIHRAVTHSLLVGAVVAAAAGAWATRTRSARAAALLALAATGVVATAVSGPLGGAVTVAFAATALVLAELGRRAGLGSRTVASAAALGVLSHPFGDLLTGEPPAFLYPLDRTLVATRPEPFADATLNLLAPLYLELATAWLALVVYLWVDGHDVGDHLGARASVGVGYAGAALLFPAPTLDVSYHFVFGLLGVGTVLAAPLPLLEVRSLEDLRDHPLRAAVTGLTAVTLATLAYTLVYLAVGPAVSPLGL